ncbi:hypothetical protein [Limnofasciculus baicalensis]|uniref:Uncharacterized protein n=1 Tax=Limnofasciculus baicalensis BBK-W-15 TaxID=2699891 RepID=A0AAE3GSL2_9CYAN|nr:hypothetical protein [Limnofasciculus baicalensis]MCP2727807.1 hypothetical protein [Limnofasciculus baicalensis BBK-W-15]
MQSQIMQSEPIETIAINLTDAGYSGLFLSGRHNLSDSIWQKGENRIYLEQIVQSSNYSDLTRLLASEILYEKVSHYPPEEWEDNLAYVYAQALAITGSETGDFQILGNQWGFMYHTDKQGVKDYGTLGTHLVNTGKKAIPYLTKLLDNSEIIFYEGSQEATLGNSLRYRVKDAAAFYIGKIAGIPVKFYEQNADRDAEIERLKETLKKNNWHE